MILFPSGELISANLNAPSYQNRVRASRPLPELERQLDALLDALERLVRQSA